MTLKPGAISLLLATAIATATVFVPITQAQSFTVLHNFTAGLDGANPYTGVTMDAAGNLYGTTQYGGLQSNDCFLVNGCGTVFKLARQGSDWIFRPLYQFQGIPTGDGANPLGRVIFGPDGALYGTTAYGGLGACSDGHEFRCGTVFKLTPPPFPCRSFTCNWEETQLYDFLDATDGAHPSGEIAFDSAGNLYGTTQSNTAYELTPAHGTWSLTVLYAFAGSSGFDPVGGVQLDQEGNVYGTTVLGGTGGDGTAFQLVPSGSGWTLNTLYDFQSGSGGFSPGAGLIVGPGGNLYGGTGNGSPNPVVYELSPSNGGWIYSTLYTFPYQHCCGVTADLVMDSAGNLYGTTGGNSVEHIYGTVFRLTPSNGGWIYTDLHDFSGGSDGGLPVSKVVVDANGNLYGTASVGGANGYGVVWEITP